MTGALDVSRETYSKLEQYEALIKKWSPKINLVAKSTLADVWERHILDSARLFRFLPSTASTVLDLGSGGGMPGLVLATMAKEALPNTEFVLIESDQRKVAFLRTVVIQLELSALVVAERIEDVPAMNADVVTARALAPLPKLLRYVRKHMHDEGIALLSKGQNHAEEILAANVQWDFDSEVLPSEKDTNSVILKLRKLREKDNNGS
jgi:16S rRNA (guanine527-N7)-methyltransferase